MSKFNNYLSCQIFAFGLLLIANLASAIDPVTIIKPEANPIHQRFTLIGAISEGSGNGKGIAVIKDHVAGKSLTVKVGDEILQNSNLRLSKIQKNRAILDLAGDSWIITYEVADRSAQTQPIKSNQQAVGESGQLFSGSLEKIDETESIDSVHSTTRKEFINEPGLFERWYSNLKLKEYSSKQNDASTSGDAVVRRIEYEDPQDLDSDLEPLDPLAIDDDDVRPLSDEDLQRKPARRIYRD